MAPLVGNSNVQLLTRRPELIKCSLHVRLPAGCTAHEIACDESEYQKPHKQNGTTSMHEILLLNPLA
jgi:hypothetical protein